LPLDDNSIAGSVLADNSIAGGRLYRKITSATLRIENKTLWTGSTVEVRILAPTATSGVEIATWLTSDAAAQLLWDDQAAIYGKPRQIYRALVAPTVLDSNPITTIFELYDPSFPDLASGAPARILSLRILANSLVEITLLT
jgi:hypothetical protein